MEDCEPTGKSGEVSKTSNPPWWEIQLLGSGMVLEFIPGCCLWTPVKGLHLLYHPPVSHKDSVFFKTFSPGGCIWRRSFFSQVLAVVQRRNITTLTPGPSSWTSPVCSSCLASAVWLFTAGSWAACLHSLPPLWITLGFTSRINDCFLLCSLGKPACLKISRKTPHSPPLPLQIWDDYKKRELKKEIIGSSFPWC